MQKRLLKWIAEQDAELPDPRPKQRTPPEKLLMAWRRMVLTTLHMWAEILCQTVTDYLTSRNRGTIVKMPPRETKQKEHNMEKKNTKIRRGIGQTLTRSKACKEWSKEPSECAHEEDQLRQRGSKDMFWWTCLSCGSRWERLEWAPDQALNSGAASSEDFHGQAATIQTSSPVPYPGRLPPPRSRPELKALLIESATNVPNPMDPLMPQEGRLAPGFLDTEDGGLPMPLENPLNRQGLVPPATSGIPMSLTPPPSPDQQLDARLKAHSKERRRQMSSGVRPSQVRAKPRTPTAASTSRPESHEIFSSEEDTPKALEDFHMVNT